MSRKIKIGIAVCVVICSLLSLSVFADFQIDNLQSYSIVFNNRVYEIEEASAYSYTFNINFTVGSNNSNLYMRAMRISNDGLAFTIDYMSLQTHTWVNVYDNGWTNSNYKYVVFKSGEDCTNQWLCNFVNNSAVTAGIQHVILPNPYSNYINEINAYNYTNDFASYISGYANYQTGVQAFHELAKVGVNFYGNALMYPLLYGGILILIVALLKRAKVSVRVDDDSKYHNTKIGFRK